MSDAGDGATGPDATAAGTDTGGAEVVRGPLLNPEVGDRLETADRERPIPGGEPECPLCGGRMLRRVERHPAPRGGASPFRVRLTCLAHTCRAWTVYDW